MIYTTLHNKLKFEQHQSHLKLCMTWVGSSYSTSDTHHATVKRHEYYTIIHLVRRIVSQRKIMSPEGFIIFIPVYYSDLSRYCTPWNSISYGYGV